MIDELLSHELSSLEENPKYQAALKIINDLQQPVLVALSSRIKEPLSEFLPNIKDVKINISEDSRHIRYRRDFDVEIDDGTLTSIEHKGDGVQSLAALGLLKNKFHRTDASIIAIEEPESHLHPGAIHQLQEIIESLEGENQIVLTTHNPLFVNRHSIASNIIVDGGKAIQSKSIKAIRDILGVKVSDNLTHARFSLVVEGPDDKKALDILLPNLSTTLGSAIKRNNLIIDYIGGAGNLSYKLSTLKSQLCVYHVFLDNDDEANKQRDRAMQEDVLSIKNLTQTICNGMTEAEFEDCLNPDIYKQKILDVYGVDLNVTAFRGNQKWSDRVKSCFQSQGKLFDKNTKEKVKRTVSECISNNVNNALCPHKRGCVDGLVSSLERLIAN
ncbi:MAG: ATP-dependent nuclease [Alphaproteobacteria bacterium]